MSDADDIRKCPDCGATLSWEKTRKTGRAIRKEEFAMTYLDRPDEYAKLPEILGRPVGQWHQTFSCSRCQYREEDGVVTRRRVPNDDPR